MNQRSVNNAHREIIQWTLPCNALCWQKLSMLLVVQGCTLCTVCSHYAHRHENLPDFSGFPDFSLQNMWSPSSMWIWYKIWGVGPGGLRSNVEKYCENFPRKCIFNSLMPDGKEVRFLVSSVFNMCTQKDVEVFLIFGSSLFTSPKCACMENLSRRDT